MGSSAAETNPISIAGSNNQQFTHILGLIGHAREDTRVKIEKPPTYTGDRSELRIFIAQCTLYFQATGTTGDALRIT